MQVQYKAVSTVHSVFQVWIRQQAVQDTTTSSAKITSKSTSALTHTKAGIVPNGRPYKQPPAIYSKLLKNNQTRNPKNRATSTTLAINGNNLPTPSAVFSTTGATSNLRTRNNLRCLRTCHSNHHHVYPNLKHRQTPKVSPMATDGSIPLRTNRKNQPQPITQKTPPSVSRLLLFSLRLCVRLFGSRCGCSRGSRRTRFGSRSFFRLLLHIDTGSHHFAR